MTSEQFYFDTLKRIAKGYMGIDDLERWSEKKYGLNYHEALEMAYENIRSEASRAVSGKRRPKDTP